MRNTWRPPNFKNPYSSCDEFCALMGKDAEYAAFEAGADALMEALKKQPTSIRSGGVTYTGYAQTPELAHEILERAKREPIGIWIFIPDDVKDVCKHEWIPAQNDVINGKYCVKCHALIAV